MVSMILNLDELPWLCFLRDQLISYTVAEMLAREENSCLPPAFACFALEAFTLLLVYTACCNAVSLASALSLLNLKKGLESLRGSLNGELLQASHKNCDIQRLEQDLCCLKCIEVLGELVPSSDAQEF